MPTYSYRCQQCNNQFTWITTYEGRNSVCCPICNLPAILLLSFNNNTTTIVMETLDKERDIKAQRGIKGLLRERIDIHKKTTEKGEFVEKHGINNAIKKGYFDGEKEKCM